MKLERQLNGVLGMASFFLHQAEFRANEATANFGENRGRAY